MTGVLAGGILPGKQLGPVRRRGKEAEDVGTAAVAAGQGAAQAKPSSAVQRTGGRLPAATESSQRSPSRSGGAARKRPAGSSISGPVPAIVPSLRQISVPCRLRWVTK